MVELRLWLSLLKLRVVVLLQVTAIAAILAHDLVDRQLLRTMVVGNDPRSWAQTLETALVVLLGGSMASGGSMAINRWYDRDIDPLMARTDRRPLPSGELAPGAVLAYGVTVCASGIALVALLALAWPPAPSWLPAPPSPPSPSRLGGASPRPGPDLAQIWTRSGPGLGQVWTRSGPDLLQTLPFSKNI